MRSVPPWMYAGVFALAGCSTPPTRVGGSDGTGAATTGGFTSSTGPADSADATTVAVTSSRGGTDTDPGSTTEPGSTFITRPDMGGSCVLAPPSGLAFPCDTYAQDCPRGEKCNPFACGSDLWNATVCVPIAREPAQIGEPCQVEGPTSPFDDCDIGLMCMFVDDAGEGECVGMCQGNAFSPVCDEGTCYLGFHGVVQVCLQPCDPLGDACSAGACVPNPYGGFVCFPSVAPVGLGDACEHDAQCPPSAVCRGRAPTCVTVCDLQAPAPVSGCAPDEACSPWPGPKRLPPEHADVGVCTPA